MTNIETHHRETGLIRRHFLKCLTGLVTAAVVPVGGIGAAAAHAATGGASERRLSLVNLNGGDRFDGVYWADGRYLPDSLRRLEHLLRDHRTSQTCRMDPHLYDQLWQLQRKLDLAEPYEVVCGYRTKRTNALARRRSRGVAKQSLHMSGRAVDIRIQEKSIASLADAARSMSAGGVGYYPRSGFVHIDTGAVRTW